MWILPMDIAQGPAIDSDGGASYAPLIVIIVLAIIVAVGLIIVLRAVRQR